MKFVYSDWWHIVEILELNTSVDYFEPKEHGWDPINLEDLLDFRQIIFYYKSLISKNKKLKTSRAIPQITWR